MINLFLEICSNDELPEVELISLLEETIPQYKLRADTLTQFTGNIIINSFDSFYTFILIFFSPLMHMYVHK